MRGDGSPEQLVMLGSQRQRAEAYAAVAARATPGGGDRPTPVALGSSIPEGLEARAAAAMSLAELVKLPTYSMARIASETDDFVRRAPFPITNVSPAAEPMTAPTHHATRVLCLNWRPSALTGVYTPDGVRLIMGWFNEMQEYEDNGKHKSGSGLRRPTDLILGDEYVQPDAPGRLWYLLDHVRSGGVAPIVPLEEARPLAPVIDAKRVRGLGRDYHDKRVLDQLRVTGNLNSKEEKLARVTRSLLGNGRLPPRRKINKNLVWYAHTGRARGLWPATPFILNFF